MALTITWVQSYFDFNNANPYDTSVGGTNRGGEASIVLTAGRLYRLAIVGHSSVGQPIVSSAVHDSGGTPTNFARVTDGVVNAASQYDDPLKAVEVWEAYIASTTASAGITITFNETQSAMGVIVYYYTGHDTGGANVQVDIAEGSGTSAAVTFGDAFSDSNNLTEFVIASGASGNSITEDEGRTELAQLSDGERQVVAVHYQNPHGSDASLTATVTSDAWGVIATEVKVAAAAGADIPELIAAPVVAAERYGGRA